MNIKIGNIEIQNVTEENGILKKIDRRKRSRINRKSWMDDMNSITNRSLWNLVAIAFNLSHANYEVSNLDNPILTEYILKLLKCSPRTAYNYANTLTLLSICF